MFVTKSTTIGSAVKILLTNSKATIIGEVPSVIIDEETKFNSPKAAEIIRLQGFNIEKDKQLNAALLTADYEKASLNNRRNSSRSPSLKKAIKAKKDNYVHLFNKNNNEFPIGLLSKVTGILESQGIDYQIEDQRVKPTGKLNWNLKEEWLKKARQYQMDGAKLTDEHPRLLFDWATNSGKTLLMSLIACRRSVKTLLLTHSGVLARQCRDAFKSYFDVKATILDGPAVRDGYELTPLTIAVINTARNKITELKAYGFDTVMVDEAHKSAALSYAKVINLLSPYYMYGFTGTAFRHGADNIVLEAQYGAYRPKISNKEMIDAGHSCAVKVKFVEVNVNVKKDDPYSLVYKNGVVANDSFNTAVALETIRQANEGKCIVIQVAQKLQGKILHFTLQESGIKSILVDGDNSAKENYRRLNQFKKGNYQVAIGTVINEGFDHDGLDVVINAAGYKAKGLIKQKLGRVLRVRPDKEYGTFVDFYVWGHFILEKHSRMRAETLESEGFDVPILKKIREEEASRAAEKALEQKEVDDKFKKLIEEHQKNNDGTTIRQRFSKSFFVSVDESTEVDFKDKE